MKFLLLMLLAVSAHAERVIMEGKPSTNNSILVSSNAAQVDISTNAAYAGSVPNVGLYVTSNVVVGNCVFYSTGSAVCPTGSFSNAEFTGGTVANQTTFQSSVTLQNNAFSVGGSTFAVIGGSVGIGVAIPQTQLQIFSANGADPEAPTTGGAPNGMLNIQTTNNVQMSLGISTSSNSGWIQVYNSPTVNPAFNLSLSPQGGNVGIGVLNCTTSNTWYHCVGGAGAVSGGLMYGQSGTEQTACTSGSGTLKSTAICSN